MKRIKLSQNIKFYYLAVIFFYISFGGFNMLQGIYIKELNYGENYLGMLISLKTIAIALLSFPATFFLKKLQKKKSLMISYFVMSLTIIFQSYFQSKILILIFSLLQGAFNALLAVTEAPFLMDNTKNEDERIKAFSYLFSVSMFSTMIGFFLFGNIVEFLNRSLSYVESLKFSLVISGLVALISVPVIFLIKDDECKNCARDLGIYEYREILKSNRARSFLIYNFIIGFGAGLVVPYFNVYLKYKVNITNDTLGTIMALSQMAMGIGGLITPYMSKVFGKVRTIIICQIASIPFLMIIASPPSILFVAVAFVLRSSLMNMAGPVISNMSMELVEHEKRPYLSSLLNLSSSLSRGISAYVAGIIMSSFKHGYEIPYFITSVLYIIATFYFYSVFKNRRGFKVYNLKKIFS